MYDGGIPFPNRTAVPSIINPAEGFNMKVLTFAATNSRKSINKQLVKYAATKLANAEIDYVEINDFDLPIYNIDLEEQYGIPKCAHAFQARIEEADVILVSFAEHNGNFTVAFKNLFDWMSRIGRNVYRDKPIVMLATSPGPGGGNTVLKLAETAAPFFSGKVVGSLSIPSFFDNFDVDRGKLTNGDLVEKLETVLNAFSSEPQAA
ncbi:MULTISPECIES: NADPH-dependent FMN reductase [Marinobacter]|uniref:FMN reductase n=1 Tax=Marinobacter salsuginis TaxID=418719 RepID=A0A5M3PRD7_9GAMM|nr:MULTISPECIES: NAD(P)H-dependent oxidoreductase [Marinobacter]GBO85434.1 FMN reductase [Marinobacter salsuginis]